MRNQQRDLERISSSYYPVYESFFFGCFRVTGLTSEKEALWCSLLRSSRWLIVCLEVPKHFWPVEIAIRNVGLGKQDLQWPYCIVLYEKKGMEDFKNVSLSVTCFETDWNLNRVLNYKLILKIECFISRWRVFSYFFLSKFVFVDIQICYSRRSFDSTLCNLTKMLHWNCLGTQNKKACLEVSDTSFFKFSV